MCVWDRLCHRVSNCTVEPPTAIAACKDTSVIPRPPGEVHMRARVLRTSWRESERGDGIPLCVQTGS